MGTLYYFSLLIDSDSLTIMVLFRQLNDQVFHPCGICIIRTERRVNQDESFPLLLR